MFALFQQSKLLSEDSLGWFFFLFCHGNQNIKYDIWRDNWKCSTVFFWKGFCIPKVFLSWAEKQHWGEASFPALFGKPTKMGRHKTYGWVNTECLLSQNSFASREESEDTYNSEKWFIQRYLKSRKPLIYSNYHPCQLIPFFQFYTTILCRFTIIILMTTYVCTSYSKLHFFKKRESIQNFMTVILENLKMWNLLHLTSFASVTDC